MAEAFLSPSPSFQFCLGDDDDAVAQTPVLCSYLLTPRFVYYPCSVVIAKDLVMDIFS